MKVNRSVLLLSLSRISDAVANSFLIIILPGYLTTVLGTRHSARTIDVLILSVPVTTELLIGVLLAAYGLISSLCQPVAGWYADRTGAKKGLIIVGLGLLAVSIGAYAHLTTYLALLAFRVLQGVGASFVRPTTVALLNALSVVDEKGQNMGMFNVFRFLGYGFGPVVAGAIAENGPYLLGWVQLTGFEMAFYAAALLAALSMFSVAVFVENPDSDSPVTDSDSGLFGSISILGTEEGSLLDSTFALAVAAFLTAINISLYATLQSPINDRLGQGEFLFGIQFAMVMLACVFFLIPVGRACDRIGRRPFLLVGFLLLAPSVLAQGVITTSGLMIVARLFQGVGAAMIIAPGLALAGDIVSSGQETTELSFLTMGFALGTAIGPMISGVLASYGLFVPFAFGTLLALVGLAIVYFHVPESNTLVDTLASERGGETVGND